MTGKKLFKRRKQREKLEMQSYAYFIDYLRKQIKGKDLFKISQDDTHWVINTNGEAAAISSVCDPLSYALNCSVTPYREKKMIEIDMTQSSRSQTVINYIATALAFVVKTLVFYFLIIFLMSILHMGGWTLLLSKKYLTGVILLAVIASIFNTHHEIAKAKEFNLKALYY